MNLEDSLTDSIRRAKERVYNISYGVTAGFQSDLKGQSFAGRNRAHSQVDGSKGEKQRSRGQGTESALAGAMKNLQ